MNTFYSLNKFLKSPASSNRFAVTIGVFDGVHRAHQKIINTLTRKAKTRHLSTLLITFWPHPANVLNPSKKVPLLISLKHRLRLLENLGVDYSLVLHFNKKMSRMSAANFIKKIFSKIYIREIIIGENFFFGKDKKGSLKDLKKFSVRYGYKLNVVDSIKSGGKIVSSTWIRKLILKGELKKASKLLLAPVTVLGTVVRGYRRGRILGFRTANIDPHHEVIPPSGVYAIKVKLDNRVYKGILNIGTRPTFKGKGPREPEPTIEAHIFNFNKYIYGKDLQIIFVKRIRKEKRFKNTLSLRKKIQKDEEIARRILKGSTPFQITR